MPSFRPNLFKVAAPLTLVLGLTLSAVLSWQAEHAAKATDQQYIERLGDRLQSEIIRRIRQYEYGLRGTMALWQASPSVKREAFARLVRSHDLGTEFPGARGLGFIRRVKRADLTSFLAETRTDHAPEFQLKTKGNADDLYVIEFIEPLASNRPAEGFDVGQEFNRRVSAERAMLTGQASLTRPIILVQAENEGTGFLIYYPVYKNGPHPATEETRRASLLGWVYMPIVARHIFAAIDQDIGDEIDFRVYDGADPQPDRLIYDGYAYADKPKSAEPTEHRCHSIATLPIGGLTWTVYYGASATFVATPRLGVYSVAVGGPLLTLMLCGLLLNLGRTASQAQALATAMTADLAAAKRQSELLSLVATHTTNAVIMSDAENRITWVNEGFTRLTGYSAEEAIGQLPDQLLLSPLAEPHTLAAIRASEDQATGFRGEVLIRSKAGRDHWVDLDKVPLRDTAGRLTGYIAVTLDITERKQAEHALREKEERLALATLINGIGIWDWNLVTGEMIWDDSMFALYHIHRKDFTGTEEAWRKSLHPDDLARGDQEVADAIADKKPFDTVFRVVWPNGEIRHIKAVAKVFRDEKNTPLRMLGTNWDITSLMRAEAEIRSLNAGLEKRVAERTTKLELANKELEAFSYSVAHDLRAPLRAVDGFARMLIEEYATQLDENGQRMLNVIHDEGQRMGRLIDDLLAFSRISRQQTEPVPIDMQAMAQEVYNELRAHEPGRTIQFELTALPTAFGTPVMIRQVWENLMSNSLKFTRQRPVSKIEIGTLGRKGADWVYYIKDNGVGFDMRHANKLFRVFHRLHSQPELEGTGVGLALVQRILQSHGGQIWAESAVDQGACFYFTLPAPPP